MHGLAFGSPSDAHECKLGQGFNASYIALGLFGEARPLLLDILQIPGFCKPGNGPAGY